MYCLIDWIIYIGIFILGNIAGRYMKKVIYVAIEKEKCQKYDWLELLVGAICVITFIINGVNIESFFLCIYAVVLIMIGWIDWKSMVIPDRLILAICVCAIPFFFIETEIVFWSRIVGFFIVSVPMLLMSMIVSGAFGGGDIKLMAVSGLILGMKGIMIALCIGIFIGGLYAVCLLLLKKVHRKDAIPFGPSLCMGCYMGALYGNRLIEWYQSIVK